jgi:hypothetical protein
MFMREPDGILRDGEPIAWAIDDLGIVEFIYHKDKYGIVDTIWADRVIVSRIKPKGFKRESLGEVP